MEFLHAVTSILLGSWHVLVKAAPYMLLGLFVAGLLRALIPQGFVDRHLGGAGFLSVVKASLIGVPLPVCSCGVIPLAMGLRRQGAGRGATTAFLIATPETGVDSISITYALLDPLMTIVRPLAAFATALTAGFLVNSLPDTGEQGAEAASQCGGSETPCCNGNDPGCCCACHVRPGLVQRLQDGLRFSFSKLMGDIGPVLLLGFLIAGIISFFVPESFIEDHLGGGLVPMLIMLLAGIPVYVCATASTPIVAALALKGLSPGAALVFMLAGPATNVTTIGVIASTMGKRVAVVYVTVIAAVSLLLGVAVNYLYGLLALDIGGWAAAHDPGHGRLVPVAAAFLLLALIVRSSVRSMR